MKTTEIKRSYQKPELVLCYEEEERQRGLREATIKNYLHQIKTLLLYLEERQRDVKEVKPSDAMKYIQYLLDERKTDKSIVARHIEGLKSFYRYLLRKKLVYANPFKGLKKISKDRKIPRNLPKEKEMDELLEKTKDFNKGTRFDRIRKYKLHVLYELLYSTGMRISEAAKLKVEDIDFDRGLITINDGKGGESRMAVLNDYAKEILRIYLGLRELIHPYNFKRDDSLFKVSPDRLIIMANKELKNYGNYTSHIFRHSVGYHLLKAGCDMRYIQEILGHKNLMSTEIYTKVDKEDLLNVLDTYHPRKFHETR